MFKKSVNDAWTSVKRGNMLLLAIGVLIGASFNAVISSLANDVIMAAIASLFNVQAVSELKAGPVLIGKFLAALISFIIVALIIFLFLILYFLIKNAVEARKAKKNPPVVVVAAPTTDELILQELKKLNENIDELRRSQLK
ncbi:Large-conductance mechanosensitive channel [Mycoplasmopsis agalactiae 14628]|uniref:Large-conductance mechanosensitive channel n=1 Tax=Mycoplasmopsis agalactiae 14628 TaxID=1110504 RepID=I5D6J1_MYCAA|nr:MscL family protein [Mycoplasmopsis agalactiae]EIN15300.1 Large-conductance mechanosensitive channel [Mycoplasmopsis agalactiae 14628]